MKTCAKCGAEIEGRRTYCEACAEEREREVKREYAKRKYDEERKKRLAQIDSDKAADEICEKVFGPNWREKPVEPMPDAQGASAEPKPDAVKDAPAKDAAFEIYRVNFGEKDEFYSTPEKAVTAIIERTKEADCPLDIRFEVVEVN